MKLLHFCRIFVEVTYVFVEVTSSSPHLVVDHICCISGLAKGDLKAASCWHVRLRSAGGRRRYETVTWTPQFWFGNRTFPGPGPTGRSKFGPQKNLSIYVYIIYIPSRSLIVRPWKRMVGRRSFPFGMVYSQGRTVKLPWGNSWSNLLRGPLGSSSIFDGQLIHSGTLWVVAVWLGVWRCIKFGCKSSIEDLLGRVIMFVEIVF